VSTAPIEFRKWFQFAVVFLSLAIAGPCFWALHSAIQGKEESLQLFLLVLFIGAIFGFTRLLTMFTPILLTKLWPQVESPTSKT
jgi:hypothetical protein